MSTTMRTLTAQQKAVCVLVGCGETQKDAAKEVGVCEDTVSRWYRDVNGIGEAMAYWTGVYADRFTTTLLGKALKKAEAGLDEADPNAYLWAAEVVTKRIAQVEKRNNDRARLELDRDALSAKLEANKPQEVTPGIVYLPLEEEGEAP